MKVVDEYIYAPSGTTESIDEDMNGNAHCKEQIIFRFCQALRLINSFIVLPVILYSGTIEYNNTIFMASINTCG